MNTTTLPRVEWIEARCPTCPLTHVIRQGFRENGEFFREQAYCPPSAHHRTKRLMRPLGILPGTVQVKAAKHRRKI